MVNWNFMGALPSFRLSHTPKMTFKYGTQKWCFMIEERFPRQMFVLYNVQILYKIFLTIMCLKRVSL